MPRRARSTPSRPLNRAEERAVRAAALAQSSEPILPVGFVGWALARIAAMLVLVAAGWAVYTCASSDRFTVRHVEVEGNVLLGPGEVEAAAGVTGANIFWIDREQVAARLGRLPSVQRVDVEPTLPDSVDIRIVERQPAAFWISGGQSYLVDREGVILKAVDAETQQARACAGQPCDPRLAPLPTVAQLDNQPLTPGDRVEGRALSAAARLAELLPAAGIQPVGFTWSADTGLEVPTRDGWRARFDDTADVGQQVATLQSIRDYLARTKASAQLIDVRFGDRPYYQ